MHGKWGYSTDQEHYDGVFGSADEAIAEGLLCGAKVVGQYRAPAQPESFLCVKDILEHIDCQDDYIGDFAEWWPSTSAQDEELEDALRKVFGEWLDKHDLRPEWAVVESDTIREIGHPDE